MIHDETVLPATGHCIYASMPSEVLIWRKLFLMDEYVHMSRILRKPDFCLCKNKGADQLRSNCEADQRLRFRYMDSTIPLLSKSKISSL